MKSTNQFPKVSIVVASYNYAKFLSRRIDSLIAQTYPNIEILIIDDHSSDDSVTVLWFDLTLITQGCAIQIMGD